MNPIITAACLMGDRKIVRRATAKTESSTVFLWELNDGSTIELVRNNHGFQSAIERGEGFEELMSFYSRSNARVFSPNLARAA